MKTVTNGTGTRSGSFRQTPREYFEMTREPSENAFWSVNLEILFRGFSRHDMELAEKRISEFLNGLYGERVFPHKEIQTVNYSIKAFKDIAG